MKRQTTREMLASAVAAAAPACAGMFMNVRECAAETRNEKTNPRPPFPVESIPCEGRGEAETKPGKAIASAQKGAGMFMNVQECAAPAGRGNDETNPTSRVSGLTPRQIAGARLLALGRSGRAVAAEIDVDEHTITRWRRLPAFAAEVAEQHRLILAEQCRPRRADPSEAHIALAARLARKYGVGR